MGMINCPDCTKRISDSAAICPKCGAKLTEDILIKAKSNEKVLHRLCRTGCLSFILLAAGLWGIEYFIPGRKVAENALPPHQIAHYSKLSSGGSKIHIHSDNPLLSERDCINLVEEYREKASSGGQVAVHKPSLKLDGTMNPWCVDNMDGRGIFFNSALF